MGNSMRLRFGILSCLIGLTAPAIGQKNDFQQELIYQIEVTLNDQTQELRGNIRIGYIHQGPEPLKEIYMHLWANAFKNRNSAYRRQALNTNDTKLYFAPPEDQGYYQNLAFSVNERAATWQIEKNNPDIARIKLENALHTGDTAWISTPFVLKIPASFSRLGRVETSYQMTQWYPKPAVFDRKGWHPIPYLNIGEFYSDFGTYDVQITLPENYVVGATGLLNTPSEQQFLQEKVAQSAALCAHPPEHPSDSFPASAAKMKTLTYHAEKVHDFAWFADKRFLVLQDTAVLSNGARVMCYAMFTPSDIKLWSKAARYVRNSVIFYSEKVGNYPWPQATAVHSALSAGGGMEYPMITVIGNSRSGSDLDEVIAHEVGHNWFYGILASNERDHPFLDEGINSYYEYRYMQKHYGRSIDPYQLPNFLHNPARNGPLLEYGLDFFEHEQCNTPPDSPSDLFSPSAYGLMVYMKTAWCMRWMENQIGTEALDQAIQAYFQKWKFRHPYPEDFLAVMNENEANANWFLEAMQTKHGCDYAIDSVHKTQTGFVLKIENKGDLPAPFPVSVLKNGKTLKTIWQTGFSKKPKLLEVSGDADMFIIDKEHITLDGNRKNNQWRVTGIFHRMEPLIVRPNGIFQENQKSMLGVLPWMGGNQYDGAMVGLFFYKPIANNPPLQWFVAPAFGLKSKQLVGLADVRWSIYPGGLIPKLTLGLNVRQFNFDQNSSSDTIYQAPFSYLLHYRRIAPQLRLELLSPSRNFRHQLIVQLLAIQEQKPLFQRFMDGKLGYYGKDLVNYTVQKLSYQGKLNRFPNPFSFVLNLEAQNHYINSFGEVAKYLRSTLEWRQQFYYKQQKSVTARFFGGAFLRNTDRHNPVAPNALTLNPQGFNDYRYDYLFGGRSETTGFWSKQVSQSDGGFKAAFGSAQAGNIGNSNSFILALNLKADLPYRLPLGLPLKPWFDLGYFKDATPLGKNRSFQDQFLWSGGVMLEFGKGFLEVYFPLINCKPMRNLYAEQSGGNNPSALFSGGSYLKWITWSIKLPFRYPGEAIESFIR